ncbi:hypothetical protein H6785_03320 [Candidatus Nomurabacteria bacterium]|nr:hypothetical protein [Candidatus Nomurabacteria bacterium]
MKNICKRGEIANPFSEDFTKNVESFSNLINLNNYLIRHVASVPKLRIDGVVYKGEKALFNQSFCLDKETLPYFRAILKISIRRMIVELEKDGIVNVNIPELKD